MFSDQRTTTVFRRGFMRTSALVATALGASNDLPALWAQQHDLEYEIHADDPMPGVISSFAYMRGVLAGMRYAQKTAA